MLYIVVDNSYCMYKSRFEQDIQKIDSFTASSFSVHVL
jgi:hypothetical protein